MNSLQKAVIKKIINVLLLGLVIPAAEQYVKETSNPYDDKAVQFVKDFVENFLKKIN